MAPISDQVKTGLKELPTNVSWLVSKITPSDDDSDDAERQQTRPRVTRVKAREKARDIRDTLAEASPFGESLSVAARIRRAGNGTSIEVRMEEAREAAWRGEQAEQEAMELAQEAESMAEYAREVNEAGAQRLKEAEQEADQRVKERRAEAEREAEQMIKEREQAAREEADEALGAVREQVQAEIEDAQEEAEEARAHAEEALEEATELLAEARRRAEEAKQAAIEAAEAAQRQAEELSAEAEEQARGAEERIAAAEEIRQSSRESVKQVARKMQNSASLGDLDSHTKAELLELAAGIGVPGRTRMSKAELVEAIKKSKSGDGR